MSNEPTKKPKRKVIFIDDGFGSPDDPIFSEGWTIGSPRVSEGLSKSGPKPQPPATYEEQERTFPAGPYLPDPTS